MGLGLGLGLARLEIEPRSGAKRGASRPLPGDVPKLLGDIDRIRRAAATAAY